MIWYIFGLCTCVKLLLIPAYHSTDFEVHRNWLAITHSLPINKWYYDSTSEWTLDYPPLFAWFEYFLSHIAKWFDPEMLKVTNLNYSSTNTILFQRLSVIVADIVFAYGTNECCTYLSRSGVRKSSKWNSKWRSPTTMLQILLLGNAGLILVDHIHFQYNGFLFGFLLLSVAKLLQGHCLEAAVYFTILLNLKHIFLYIAPPYFIYLLRNYCFKNVQPGFGVDIKSFSRQRFLKLCFIVICIFSISFGPFIYLNQLPQIISRLFPFKRGLSHSYWAPNFWAFYNTADKCLEIGLKRLGIEVNNTSSMTQGLVQEFSHSVLPNITPKTTFLLSLFFMCPSLLKLWRCPGNTLHFVRALVICGLTSYIFGYHVHEKAILIAIIPLTVLTVIWQKEAQIYLILSVTGHYSLFPLFFTKFELPIKVLIVLIHSFYSFINLSYLFDERQKSIIKLPLLNIIDSIYLLGFIPLFIFDTFLIPLLGINIKLPFLGLMLTSFYCSIGILFCYMKYYWHFMTMSEINHKRKTH